jgi:hypothetical protein
VDGDPVDLLGELYEQDPRWRVRRLWRYERGHMSIHTTAMIRAASLMAETLATVGSSADSVRTREA